MVTRLCIWRTEDFYQLSFSCALAFCLTYHILTKEYLSLHLVMKIRFSVNNVLCHGPWLCCGPEARRGAGGPSLDFRCAVKSCT